MRVRECRLLPGRPLHLGGSLWWADRPRGSTLPTHQRPHEPADVAGVVWLEARDAFFDHYAGCRRSGLAEDQLAEELLVDAMVMITRHIAHRGPGWHNGNFVAWEGYYDPEGNRYGDAFGYYDAGGFTGCLAEGASPPQHLMDAIREALLHNGHTESTP